MKHTLCLFLTTLFIVPLPGHDWIVAQEEVVVAGRVLREDNGQGVDFASVSVLEVRKKVHSEIDGSYRITLPPGQYTFIIQASGLQPQTQPLDVKNSINQNFRLSLIAIQGTALEIKANRDYQKISRTVVDKDEMDLVAGSFGDSLGALNAMPGIVRSPSLAGTRGGPFGHLIIRGARHFSNRYFVDDVPLIFPQHGGFQHSTISNEITREIVVFSSAAPAEYGEVTGAIIEIKTIDEIPKFNGLAGISFVSANTFVAGPIKTSLSESTSAINQPQFNDEYLGHWALAGRVSFYTAILPKLVNTPSNLPVYNDYQAKGEFFLDSKAHHSMGALIFGSYNTMDYRNKKTKEFEQESIASGLMDPLYAGQEMDLVYHSHSQALFYNYRPSAKLSNRFLVFNSYNKTQALLTYPLASTINTDANAQPVITGIKNKASWQFFKDVMELRAGIDISRYHIKGFGAIPALINPTADTKNLDFMDSSIFQQQAWNVSTSNMVYGFYLEDKITIGGLTLLPGIRIDHLDLSSETTFDPRALISYGFASDTTLSAAGGLYHAFPQTNSLLFLDNSGNQAVAYDRRLEAEKSLQRSLAIEQAVSDFTLRLEAFYNSFDNLIEFDPSYSTETGMISSGQASAKGFEVLLRKKMRAASGAYGWISYTYTKTAHKSQVPGDPEGQISKFAPWDMTHSIKMIAGYRIKQGSTSHDISSRFDLSSGFPYTPIIGHHDAGEGRYLPLYGGSYSKRYQTSHRLDLKYTNISHKSWGEFRWYIDLVNVYYFRPLDMQQWRYNQPYSTNNPRIISNPNNFDLMPIGGIEIRF